MGQTEQRTETDKREENKMGIMPVKRLIVSMSLPMMASMLVQALYNIVDSIFVSRIGEDALTAVSMAFPVQTLMVAVAVGTGGKRGYFFDGGQLRGFLYFRHFWCGSVF